jgi:hypothetical protein
MKCVVEITVKLIRDPSENHRIPAETVFGETTEKMMTGLQTSGRIVEHVRLQTMEAAERMEAAVGARFGDDRRPS